MMSRASLVAALMAVPALAFAASSQPGLHFAGCSISQVAYMQDMAKAFESKYHVAVDVKGGGVPVGIRKTLDGKVELGGSCRHLLPKEKDEGAVSTVIGYDMLVFITHPSNPIDSLSMDQVRRIFAGQITDWKDVGGPDRPVVLVGRESDDAGVATMFREKVMRDTPISEKRVNLPSTAEAEKAMETSADGIAVTGISSAVLRKVKILKLNVVAPDRASFRNGSYPLARPLYLVTKGPPEGLTKQFIDFVRSEEGQSIVSRHAFTIADYCQREKSITGSSTCGGQPD